MYKIGAIVLGIAAIVGVIFMTSSQATSSGMFPYQDEARVAEGAELYDEYCAACHGKNLEGQQNWRERRADGKLPAPPHDEAGHTWHHPDKQLFGITKYGSAASLGGGYETDMIGFGDVMSDEQILSVLAYIKSTWPEKVINQHNDINARAGN